MKHFLTFLFVSIILFSSVVQGIPPEEAAQAKGQYLTVTGVVASARKTQSGAVYLNFGAEYPNQIFSVYIGKGDAGQFPDPSIYTGKTVNVTGPIAIREGKPQIKVVTVEQLVIAPAPPSGATGSPTPASPTPSPAK